LDEVRGLRHPKGIRFGWLTGSTGDRGSEVAMSELTAYEAQQVEEISEWKSERPSALAATVRGLAWPLTKLVATVVPRGQVARVVEAMAERAEEHDHVGDILTAAGASSLAELRDRPLETCDALAAKIGARSEHMALLEGVIPALGNIAIPVVGGAAMGIVDVPLRLEAALRAICRIGHCYGYSLHGPSDRAFVASLLDLANVDDPRRRGAGCEAIFRLLEAGGPMPDVEAVEEAVVEDLPFEAMPYVGDVAGVFLDYALIRRVDVAARRVFQERWLRDREKVASIPPDPISHRRSSLKGVVNVAGEIAYTGSYAVGFGVTFPAMLIGTGLSHLPGPAGAGFRDGAASAARDATRVADSLRAGAHDVLAPAS
jgi:hypothetical protein